MFCLLVHHGCNLIGVGSSLRPPGSLLLLLRLIALLSIWLPLNGNWSHTSINSRSTTLQVNWYNFALCVMPGWMDGFIFNRRDTPLRRRRGPRGCTPGMASFNCDWNDADVPRCGSRSLKRFYILFSIDRDNSFVLLLLIVDEYWSRRTRRPILRIHPWHWCLGQLSRC